SYKGLDAIAIRQFGERPIFLNWNAGREALVAYLVAGMTFLSGYTAFSVRAVEALAGVATLFFFYLLAKRLFGYRIALLCLFFLADLRSDCLFAWHVFCKKCAQLKRSYVANSALDQAERKPVCADCAFCVAHDRNLYFPGRHQSTPQCRRRARAFSFYNRIFLVGNSCGSCCNP